MSDWQVGDLVVCVDDGPCSCGCGTSLEGLSANNHYTVLDLYFEEGWCIKYSAETGEYYENGYAHQRGWADAARFRKIRPDERTACEPEFVTLLKRSKRKVSA